MPWMKENGPDGLPVWRGRDEIYDRSENYKMGPFAMWVGLTVIGVPMLFQSPLLGLGLVVGGGIAAVVMQSKARKNGAEFIGDEWQLVARPDGLQLQLKPSAKMRERWAVPLDAIARVETARTAEYMPARYLAHVIDPMGRRQAVPEHEWQTFLFMADGTRRVIYHANAARDECAALAASIREYVESARAGAVRPTPARSGAGWVGFVPSHNAGFFWGDAKEWEKWGFALLFANSELSGTSGAKDWKIQHKSDVLAVNVEGQAVIIHRNGGAPLQVAFGVPDADGLAASIREVLGLSPSSSGTAGGDAPRAAGFDL